MASYYIMQADTRVTNPAVFQFSQSELEAKEPIVVYANYNEDTTFTDYFSINQMFETYFFVSDPLKEVLMVYDEKIEAIPYFITNKQRTSQMAYWKVRMSIKDCLVKEKVMKYTNLTIRQAQVGKDHIFSVEFDKQSYIVISLQLVENIIRRQSYGIRFIPVEVI